MATYSKTSKDRLATAHQDLQVIFNQVIKSFDNTILCGHRGEQEQEAAFDAHYSKVHFPHSKHNSVPSMAVDAVPYPIDWKDLERMKYFAGYVMGVAETLKQYGAISHDLVTGLDWDDDTILSDTTFKDHPHFQLK